MNKYPALAAASLLILTSPVCADMAKARCDIYPVGSDHASAMIGCVFVYTLAIETGDM
jgi:hypothetical protein